jgi:hypothetical protein
MRRAFDATMKDPLFLADAERALLEIDPMSGEMMEQLLRRAYATPKASLQRALELHGSAVN